MECPKCKGKMNNKDDFKVGDIVKLVSGGPPMTIWQIEDYKTGTKLHCVWFLGSDEKGWAMEPRESEFWSDTVAKVS